VSGARHLLLLAARTRTPLPAMAATVLAVIGVYAYRPNDVAPTLALTAVLTCGLVVWLVAAVVAGEPRAQAEMATSAIGGPDARLALEVVLVGSLTVVVTLVFLSYPLTLDAVSGGVYDRPVRAMDVLGGGAAHLACGALGGAVAVLFTAPRVERRASGAAAIAAALLALVPLGAVAGPLAVARTLSDSGGERDGAVLVALASCLALAALLVAVARAWTAARC
jgi:hypothetical protein